MYNPYELTDAAQKKYADRDPFGRIPEKTKDEDTEIKDLGDPSSLSKPVGVTGKNNRRDVAKAEAMLGAAGALDLKKTEGPTGYWGLRTEDATKSFQKKHGLKVDGQINPGGETIRMLAKVAGQAFKAFANSNHHPEQAATRRDSGSRGGGEKILNQVQDDVALRLSDNAVAENRRMADALGKIKGVGDLSRFTTDAINRDGDKAIREVADLIGQVHDRSPEQARELFYKTTQGIASESRPLLKAAMDGHTAERADNIGRFSGGQGQDTLIGGSGADNLQDRPDDMKSPDDLMLEPGEQFVPADNFRQNIKEGALRGGAWVGEKAGLETSSKYLKHFLDGSGKDIVVPRDEARKDPFIRDSEEKNRTRFENQTFLGDTKKSKLNDTLLTLKDGQSAKLTDDWDSESRYDGSIKGEATGPDAGLRDKLDTYLGYGTQELKSKSDFEATRHGNKIHIKGTVSHDGEETYDFDDSDVSLGAYELQQTGRGKPFKVIRNWQQNVEGTVDIVGTDNNGRLILGNPKFQWQDRD